MEADVFCIAEVSFLQHMLHKALDTIIIII